METLLLLFVGGFIFLLGGCVGFQVGLKSERQYHVSTLEHVKNKLEKINSKEMSHGE